MPPETPNPNATEHQRKEKKKFNFFSENWGITKKIWDTLKISHERNDATIIIKMELVEGELGRFAMKRGEEPTETYNRLKTLVNKICNYESTRWTYHDVVRLMLRSFTIIDPHLVKLIRENPRYTKMTPEEILGKFVSERMMVKEARYIDDIANGPLSLYEPHPIALKATSTKEALPNKVAQDEAIGLNEEAMSLVIKHFKTALKGRKEYPNKNNSSRKRSYFKCGKSGHFIAQCPNNDNDQAKKRKGRRRGRKTTGRRRARHTSVRNGTPTTLHPTPTMKDLLPPPSTSLSLPQRASHMPHG
jgi:hypothetical protein